MIGRDMHTSIIGALGRRMLRCSICIGDSSPNYVRSTVMKADSCSTCQRVLLLVSSNE